jgi:hypothetical protein
VVAVVSAAFTSGPWHADFGEVFRIRETDGSSVAYTQFVHLRGRRDTEEVTANANLIAAAPELYEALDALLKGCAVIAEKTGINAEAECLAFVDSPFARARAALAKARGEAL